MGSSCLIIHHLYANGYHPAMSYGIMDVSSIGRATRGCHTMEFFNLYTVHFKSNSNIEKAYCILPLFVTKFLSHCMEHVLTYCARTYDSPTSSVTVQRCKISRRCTMKFWSLIIIYLDVIIHNFCKAFMCLEKCLNEGRI